MRAGMFDLPAHVPYTNIGIDVMNNAAGQQLALEAARQSIVYGCQSITTTAHFVIARDRVNHQPPVLCHHRPCRPPLPPPDLARVSTVIPGRGGP